MDNNQTHEELTRQCDSILESLTWDGFMTRWADEHADADDYTRHTDDDGTTHYRPTEDDVTEDDDVTAEEVFRAECEDSPADIWITDHALEVVQKGERRDGGEWEVTGFEVLRTFGGPNIWMDFNAEDMGRDRAPVTVRAYWGGESVTVRGFDELGVTDYLTSTYDY